MVSSIQALRSSAWHQRRLAGFDRHGVVDTGSQIQPGRTFCSVLRHVRLQARIEYPDIDLRHIFRATAGYLTGGNRTSGRFVQPRDVPDQAASLM
jgi:hypothetical protein